MASTLEPLPYYKWMWRDYRGNRRVQRMSWQARGIFRELLDEAWSEGMISDDISELAEIVGCTTEEMERYWSQIEPCWTKVEGGYVNEKLDRQRTEMDLRRATNARNGRTGAFAKAANEGERLANAGDRLANAGERHIAEQSNAKEEQGAPVPNGSTGATRFTADMVADGVKLELRVTGQELLRNLSDIARAEIDAGADGWELMHRMRDAGRQYLNAKNEGKLTQYAPKLESFYGGGSWRQAPGHWPWWKEGCGPPNTNQQRPVLAMDKLKRG